MLLEKFIYASEMKSSPLHQADKLWQEEAPEVFEVNALASTREYLSQRC